MISKIILIGFMGSGKTTLASLLAQKLGVKAVEMDDLVLVRSGRDSIRQIFDLDGEPTFRKLESAVAHELAKTNSCVISTGGGVVTNPENLRSLAQTPARIVYLATSFTVLESRLRDDAARPLFQDRARALALYQAREPIYRTAAEITLSTDNRTPEQLADELIKRLSRQHCLVIGDPIGHSLSPLIHTSAYAATGLSERFQFTAERVTPVGLTEFMRRARTENIRGISCTIPHKQAVIPLLDKIDPLAERVGAVNTVVNNYGILTGYNTDLDGVVQPLKAITTLKDRQVALLGAGGAARATAFGLTAEGSKLTIFNRDLSRARQLASETTAEARVLTEFDPRAFDLVINATPIGMTPVVDQTPVPTSGFSAQHLVFDLIYNPLETKLLRVARDQGAHILSGVEMFIAQAVAQFELYTGQPAPRAVMRRVVLDALSALGNS